MTRLVVWPFSIKFNSSGQPLDGFQSIYSRGLCWAIAEGLLRLRTLAVTVCLPIVTIAEVVSWAVSGKELTFDDALKARLAKGEDYVLWGAMSITDRLDLHVLLASIVERRLLIDRQFSYPRTEIPTSLSEPLGIVASVIANRPLSLEERRRLGLWGTTNSEAYLGYLEAWSGAAAFRFGVSVPNPEAALQCARRAAAMDPGFREALKLQEELELLRIGSAGRQGNELTGYSEFAYPIAIPKNG